MRFIRNKKAQILTALLIILTIFIYVYRGEASLLLALNPITGPFVTIINARNRIGLLIYVISLSLSAIFAIGGYVYGKSAAGKIFAGLGIFGWFFMWLVGLNGT